MYTLITQQVGRPFTSFHQRIKCQHQNVSCRDSQTKGNENQEKETRKGTR